MKIDQKLLDWLIKNQNQVFDSPRKIFGTNPQRFEIVKVDQEKEIVEVEFKKNFTLLRLEFWRFNTALNLMQENEDEWIRLGTRFDSNDPNTIEYAIQSMARKMHPGRNIDLKSAPHICDILVLCGIAKYGKSVNSITGRENQAIRIVG